MLQSASERERVTQEAISTLSLAISDLSNRVESHHVVFDSLVINPKQDIPRQIAEIVAFKGDHNNFLYRGFIGTSEPMSEIPHPVPFSSSCVTSIISRSTSIAGG